MKEWITLQGKGEPILVTTYDDFDYHWYKYIPWQKRKRGRQVTKDASKKYKDVVCAFDIETSAIPFTDLSQMYIWMFAIGSHRVVIGRTWKEFLKFLSKLKRYHGEKEYLSVYVHNLSFEFQFLKGIYHFRQDEVFAVKSRRVLRCSMYDCFEYRCSYLQTNMSLEEFTKKMNVTHPKLPGSDLDYTRIRTGIDELGRANLEYCISDVVGLVEAMETRISNEGDNLYTVPLTSTGYVRRDTKRAMQESGVIPQLRKSLPDYDTFVMLREAFRGGNTHANRYYTGSILNDVKSADRSSSYPDVLVNCKYPVTKFNRLLDCSKENVLKFMIRFERPILTRVSLQGVRLKNKRWGCPYLTKDKFGKNSIVNGVFDNGRILSCDLCEGTITDVDWRIIMQEYDFDNYEFFDTRVSSYAYLPKRYIKNLEGYYKSKTSLKGVNGKEYEYDRSKALLNAIYGMSAQNPVKQNIIYDDRSIDVFRLQEDFNIEEALVDANKRAFLSYAWGVWCTAWARYRLEEGIALAGDNFCLL